MTHANVAEGVVWIQAAWVLVGLWVLGPLFAFLGNGNSPGLRRWSGAETHGMKAQRVLPSPVTPFACYPRLSAVRVHSLREDRNADTYLVFPGASLTLQSRPGRRASPGGPGMALSRAVRSSPSRPCPDGREMCLRNVHLQL